MSVGGMTTERGGDSAAAADAPTAPTGRSWGYRPGLDGVRAVSLIVIILYHNGIRWVPGGFLAVDVFFALSGFLITSLLLEERVRSGRIDLLEFWARRFRRLVPALLFVFVGFALYEFFAEPLVMIPSRREDAPWVLTYLTNWRFIQADATYFEAFSAPNPYRHLWTLAVEEQLYLLWPPVVAFVLWIRRGKSDVLLAVAASLAVLSAVLMAVLVPAMGDPTRSYYGTDTRAQAVMLGAAAAILVRGRTFVGAARRVLALVSMVAAAVMVFCFATIHDTDLSIYKGGFLLFGIVTTVVVVDAAFPGSPLERALGIRPLRFLGAISYGVYLWHWPIHLWINPLRFDLPFVVIVVLRAVLSVAMGWISFNAFERPVRRWLEARPARGDRPRRPRSPWLTIGAAVGSLALAIVVFGWTQRTEVVDGRFQRALRSEPAAAVTPATEIDLPDGFGPDRPLTLTVVGDSTGFTLADPALLRDVVFRNGALLGCGATTGVYYFGDFPRELPPQCANVAERWASHAKAPTDAVLVFLGGWEVFDSRVDGQRLSVPSEAWHRWITAELRDRIEVMQAAAPSVPIALVELPCPATDSMRLGLGAWERVEPERVDAVNEAIRDVAEEMGPSVRTVSYADQVCDADGNYVWRDADGEHPRPDGLHAAGPARVRIWQSLIDQLAPDLRPVG